MKYIVFLGGIGKSNTNMFYSAIKSRKLNFSRLPITQENMPISKSISKKLIFKISKLADKLLHFASTDLYNCYTFGERSDLFNCFKRSMKQFVTNIDLLRFIKVFNHISFRDKLCKKICLFNYIQRKNNTGKQCNHLCLVKHIRYSDKYVLLNQRNSYVFNIRVKPLADNIYSPHLSWLRTNAVGVPNTCKSNGVWGKLTLKGFSGGRVNNAKYSYSQYQ